MNDSLSQKNVVINMSMNQHQNISENNDPSENMGLINTILLKNNNNFFCKKIDLFHFVYTCSFIKTTTFSCHMCSVMLKK
jgi:hypothetical protein